jgi:Short C-terminal domain
MAFGRGKKEKAKNLFETGSRAIGIVLAVHDTGVTINELDLRVRMDFRIEPLDSTPAFEATKTSTVSRAAIPRAGDRYPVFYDPTDQESWAYAEVHDDKGRQQIRALFGEKAETITGVGDPMAAAPPAPAAADPLDRLKKLDELRATGVLTDDEFESKKAALLAEI